jgi:hypothetical protein
MTISASICNEFLNLLLQISRTSFHGHALFSNVLYVFVSGGLLTWVDAARRVHHLAAAAQKLNRRVYQFSLVRRRTLQVRQALLLNYMGAMTFTAMDG